MEIFNYSAKAVDGKNKGKDGVVGAIDKQDAEQQIRKMFAYPVQITLSEHQMEVIDSPTIINVFENKWNVSPVNVAAGDAKDAKQ